MAIPYASKTGLHSYDGADSYEDGNWRDGENGVTPTIVAGNPKAVHTRAEARHFRRLRERMHARRLKGKVSGWIREAKSAIVAHMTPGHLSYWRSGEDNVGAVQNS